MQEELETAILDKIERGGWTASRALAANPSEEPSPQELEEIEQAMRNLAERGAVALWRLSHHHQALVLLAASKPDLDLGAELESRGAWATAERV
jgi:hypothetical protein